MDKAFESNSYALEHGILSLTLHHPAREPNNKEMMQCCRRDADSIGIMPRLLACHKLPLGRQVPNPYNSN